MRFAYRAYGLTLHSQLELPELLPANGQSSDDAVSIILGCVPQDGLPAGTQLGPFLWADARQFWLQVPGVARFLVSEGRLITIDPAPGADDDSVRVFLLGSAFGALLFQRGRLVLHGNAVQIGGGCIVCVGHSGAGKSTLAAGFHRRGFPIIADDVVAVDDQCNALPGFPRVKLWQDVAERLGIDMAPLRRVRPDTNKFSLPVTPAPDQPTPIRWIYLLKNDHVGGIRCEPVEGMEKFMQLRQNTYRVRYLDGMAMKPRHLALCSQLANRVKLVRITRPREGFTLDPLIDRILEDVATQV